MECPHLEESAKIAAPSILSENFPVKYFCSACKTDRSPWMCLNCGSVNCGRYVNGHAKTHFENHISQHNVCMDCENLATFCYSCDEFVVNDTKGHHLAKLRKYLVSLTSSIWSLYKNKNNTTRFSSIFIYPNDDLKINDDKVKPRSSGLRNLGNTCFMNAVLQSLSNIQQFSGYIKQLPSLENNVQRVKRIRKVTRETENILVVEELRKTLIQLWQGNKAAISPESLFTAIWKVVPRFRGYQQQDAHEFMRYLLDRMHTELLSLLPYPNNNSLFIGPKGKSTIVTAIFGGLLQNEVNCLICGVESKKHDPFLDLSLDIPAQFVYKGPKNKDSDVICTLSDCLTSFTEVEELEESELYMCSNCKRKQRSTKKFWIRRLPNVLCLHLKRFRWSSSNRQKIETYVEFPLRGLDMSRYILNTHETRGTFSGSNKYDLAAVIVHHGSGAGSGHYTSYATYEGRWYHFNDSTVSSCSVETVAKCRAYIMFYIRRELKLPEYLSINGTDHSD